MENFGSIKRELRRYFVYGDDGTHDPLQPLDKDEYRRFQRLMEQAINEDENDPTLWLWKGWGHHFLSGTYPLPMPHAEFEYAEDAYEHAIMLDRRYGFVNMALTHLYWDSAIRAAANAEIGLLTAHLDQSQPPKDFLESIHVVAHILDLIKRREIEIDFGDARRQWDIFASDSGALPHLSDLEGIVGCVPTWIEIVEEFINDLGLSAEEYGDLCFYFGIALINAGYDESGEMIQGRFRKALEFTAEISVKVESLKYLSYPHTDLLEGLKCFERALELWKDPAHKESILSWNPYAIQDFTTDVGGFLDASPRLRQEYPHRIVTMIEGVEQLGLADEYLFSNRLGIHLGKCYVKLGRYEGAVKYLEQAQTRSVADSGLLWDLAISYAKLRRYNEAEAMLNLLPEKDDKVVVLMEFARQLEDAPTLRKIADILGSRQEAPDRQEFQGMVEELRSLLSELREMPEELSLRTNAVLQQHAGQWPDLGPRIKVECMSLWPDYWASFPEALRGAIQCAMTYHQLAVDQDSLGMPMDYFPVVAAWGKVGELAIKLAFAEPFGCYLDEVGFEDRLALQRQGKRKGGNAFRELREREKATWKETIAGYTTAMLLGLLFAADTNSAHPVNDYLMKFNLDSRVWKSRIYQWADRVRLDRNVSLHSHFVFTQHDALKVKSVIVSEGFLAEIGRYFSEH